MTSLSHPPLGDYTHDYTISSAVFEQDPVDASVTAAAETVVNNDITHNGGVATGQQVGFLTFRPRRHGF